MILHYGIYLTTPFDVADELCAFFSKHIFRFVKKSARAALTAFFVQSA